MLFVSNRSQVSQPLVQSPASFRVIVLSASSLVLTPNSSRTLMLHLPVHLLRQGYAVCNSTGFVSALSFHIPSTRYDYLVCWPDFATTNLNFICDQEPKVLNILPFLRRHPTGNNLYQDTNRWHYGTNSTYLCQCANYHIAFLQQA
jgi:hypothetical protein